MYKRLPFSNVIGINNEYCISKKDVDVTEHEITFLPIFAL